MIIPVLCVVFGMGGGVLCGYAFCSAVCGCWRFVRLCRIFACMTASFH